MRKSPLLLPMVVMVLSGCGGGEAYVGSTSWGMCRTKVQGLIGDIEGNKLGGDYQMSNAFSAWCWLEDCLQTMHLIIGNGEWLAGQFHNMREACGNCRLANPLPSGTPQNILDEVQGYCDNNTQYRKPEGQNPGPPQS